MHNFVYLAQRRSQEFSCEPNFGGGHAPSPGCASDLRDKIPARSVDLVVSSLLPACDGQTNDDRTVSTSTASRSKNHSL